MCKIVNIANDNDNIKKKHQTHVHMSSKKKLSECGTNVFLCAYKKEVASPAGIPLVNAVNLYES